MRACNQENCTVLETGTCLLDNEPETCPYRDSEMDDPSEFGDKSHLSGADDTAHGRATLPTSQARTPNQAQEMMGNHYFRLIGILGEPDAGKTAALVSLYLLAARGRLDGFSFANSRTLMAFHEISRGACQWNEGQLPEQLTTHTKLTDERTAGLIHIRLLSTNGQRAVDLLFPDLPGEWTTALADRNRVDRLEFIRRGDVIWLVVDGRQLCASESRQLAVHRTKLIFQRLGTLLVPNTPVILVITRRDQGEPDQQVLARLRADAVQYGLSLDIVVIASFSDTDSVEPGDGISELISKSVLGKGDSPVFWPNADEIV